MGEKKKHIIANRNRGRKEEKKKLSKVGCPKKTKDCASGGGGGHSRRNPAFSYKKG